MVPWVSRPAESCPASSAERRTTSIWDSVLPSAIIMMAKPMAFVTVSWYRSFRNLRETSPPRPPATMAMVLTMVPNPIILCAPAGEPAPVRMWLFRKNRLFFMIP